MQKENGLRFMGIIQLRQMLICKKKIGKIASGVYIERTLQKGGRAYVLVIIQ